MTHRDAIPTVGRFVNPLFLAVAVLAPWPAVSRAQPGHAHMPMTEAAMKARADAYWASHKPVGTQSKHTADAIITARDFVFDADGNLATAVDTATIFVGETVEWEWVNGSHTVTNGTGSSDPNAGTIFNQQLDNTHTIVSFTFNAAGLYPYFCIVHEGLMSGFVRVQSPVGVVSGPFATVGFTRNPYPNPTRRGASFSYSLSRAGRARAEVFDAGGRMIAVPLDLDLGAGPHDGAWDGRRRDGRPAGPGVYYLRLRLPGYLESRRIILAR